MKHLFMLVSMLLLLTVFSSVASAGYICREGHGGTMFCEDDASHRRY